MVISSTTNEWPQQEQIDETGMMASSGRLMEKQAQEQQPLKCPRCDSSNTKFCYYNNYSLSQPRHFCKACKRYWTRGGTLRNVPVGGGFRKNKRVKRSATSTDPPSLSSPTPTPLIDTSTPSNPINRWFYGLPTSHSDMNLPFPSFHSRVSNVDTMPTSCTSYDLQTQLNALGLGFGPTSQIQDGISTNSILSNYSLLGSSSSPTTASLLASSLQPQKLVLGGLKERDPSNYFQAFLPFENLQTAGKEVKMEEGNHRMSQNPIEAVGLSDPSPYWNMTGVGAWPDHSNFGSSVTPLI